MHDLPLIVSLIEDAVFDPGDDCDGSSCNCDDNDCMCQNECE
jgi:hypothetical protein